MTPSGSSLARAAACAASHALPRVESTSAAAERGTAIHRYLAAVCPDPTSRSVALAAVPAEYRETCAGIDLAAITDGLSQMIAEPAFALDVATGKVRLVGVNIGRAYGELAPTEIAGSADLIAMRADGVPVVIDFKTGQDVGEVESSWQLRLLALCLRAHRGAEDGIDARYVYLDDSGAHRVERYTYDALDLDAALEELGGILAKVRAAEELVAEFGTPTTATGEHCRYCPSLPYCPAQTALVRSMLSDAEHLDGAIASLTLEQAGAAWVKARQIRALLTRVEDSLKARAAQSPLPLPGGKVLRMLPMPGRRTMPVEETIAALRAHGAPEQEIASLVREGKGYVMAKEVKA